MSVVLATGMKYTVVGWGHPKPIKGGVTRKALLETGFGNRRHSIRFARKLAGGEPFQQATVFLTDGKIIDTVFQCHRDDSGKLVVEDS